MGANDVPGLQIEEVSNSITCEQLIQIGLNFQRLLIFTCRIIYIKFKKGFF